MLEIDESLKRYIEAHTTPPRKELQDIERRTYLKTLAPHMVSGFIQGRFLAMISKMQSPEYILEIGTFTGYSAVCLAEGLTTTGRLHTIESNIECKSLIEQSIEEANLTNKIELHFGDAIDIIPKLEIMFDLVFIDAAKTEYERFYKLIIDKINAGGIILVDNVLWSGKVLKDAQDPDTACIAEFNKMVHNDNRVENLILPIRDGIMICRKK